MLGNTKSLLTQIGKAVKSEGGSVMHKRNNKHEKVLNDYLEVNRLVGTLTEGKDSLSWKEIAPERTWHCGGYTLASELEG